MASRQLGPAERHLRILFGAGTLRGLTDGQLLSRFAEGPPEAAHAAFTALVERHGPMVLRVCRGALDDLHDAHDAFQATFLVLVRRAGAVRRHESVGSWLHGVALRVAARARVDDARRRAHERRSAEMGEGRATDVEREDLSPLLHEEVGRLPEKYRAPIVLCYLEGLTHDEAAAHLGWPVGTVRGRLARARDLLRARLTRRGAILTVAGPAMLAADAAVPAALLDSTVGAAVSASTSAVAARVTTWVGAESRSLAVGTLKGAVAALAVAGAMAAGAGLASHAASGDKPATKADGETPRTVPPDPAKSRDDREEIRGTWTTSTTVTGTRGGKLLPPDTLKQTWVITADRMFEATEASAKWAAEEHTYRYSLDPSGSPKAIDLTSPSTGILKGIYRLEGDTLRICYGFDGRPTTFEEGQGPGPVLILLKRVERNAERPISRFPNAAGCEWALFPESLGFESGCTTNRGGIVLMVDKRPKGTLIVSLAHPGRSVDAPAPEYRPVVFDAQGRRYPLKPSGGGQGGNPKVGPTVALNTYRLEPDVLPVDKATHLGLEEVTPEARRLAAEAGQAKAKAAGVEVLPPPVVGKPFDFSITATDGRTIRSRDLKGKVVLIDCWATWCSPCIQKMPALKALYERRHRDGLEVLGISFDRQVEAAREAVTSLGLAWPQALVPDDEATRTLWEEGAQVDGLPRLYLIDRKGLLQYVGGPHDLDGRVGRLLDESAGP